MSSTESHKDHTHHTDSCSCCGARGATTVDLSRREFLGGAAALGGVAWFASSAAVAAPAPAMHMRAGSPLRVKPVLTWQLGQRRELTSWRSYGGLKTPADVDQESRRIEIEIRQLAANSDFALELLPLARVNSEAEARSAAAAEADVLLVFASAGPQKWLEILAASQKPNVMFLRHRSGPLYLWYEIAHWRFLRKNDDAMAEPHMSVDDVVVDDYADVLWRLRALYGLKNTRGTKVLAIGGLQSYSASGTKLGPDHARKKWGFEIQIVTFDELRKRVAGIRADARAVDEAQRQTADLLAQKGVSLETDRRAVVDSFLALAVFRKLLAESGATNLGVANCMGGLIPILNTPPCLVTAMLNDEGYTAFCHVDFTHTPAGVLLHHISGKPSFVSNSHFPHHGMLTLAHCAAPRRMNGRDFEPTRIMTHFESDFGAATKIQYTKGQTITTLIPNLHCTRWFGLRGKILDSPGYDACRSQIDLEIDGDWQRLLREMEGFHTLTCYGDYLREVGYAVAKLGIEWVNVSPQHA